MTVESVKIMHHEKRFGFLAVKKGFITQEQLINALGVQVREEFESDSHRLLGEILYHQGVMTANQIEEVLKNIIEIEQESS